MIRWVASAVFVALPLTAAWAGPAEDEVFAGFEAFCLLQLPNPTSAATMLRAVGAVQVPAAQSAPLLGGNLGAAWYVKDRNSRFVVLLQDEKSCGVLSFDLNGIIVKQLLEKNTINRKIDTQFVGSELHETYAVSVPTASGEQRAIVLAVSSILNSLEGVTLHAVPWEVARKAGLPEPAWPR